MALLFFPVLRSLPPGTDYQPDLKNTHKLLLSLCEYVCAHVHTRVHTCVRTHTPPACVTSVLTLVSMYMMPAVYLSVLWVLRQGLSLKWNLVLPDYKPVDQQAPGIHLFSPHPHKCWSCLAFS